MYELVHNCLKDAQVGIRFELRPKDRNPDELDYLQAQEPDYFRTVVGNSSGIYEKCFCGNDSIHILCSRIGKRRNRILDSTYWMKCISSIISKSHYKPVRWDEFWWDRKVIVEAFRSSIDHSSIFHAIANVDFNIKPALRDKLFFLCIKKGLVFHMYDDRGVWISANTISGLPSLDSEQEEIIVERFKERYWPLY